MMYDTKEVEPCPVCGNDAYIHPSNCIELYYCIECESHCGVFQCFKNDEKPNDLASAIKTAFNINKLKSYLFHNNDLNEENKRLHILKISPINSDKTALYNMEEAYKNGEHFFNDIQLLTSKDVEDWYPKNFKKEIGLVLYFLAKSSQFPGDIVELSWPCCLNLFFIKHFKKDGFKMTAENIAAQISFIVDYMQEKDLLEYVANEDKFLFKLLPEGWMRIPDLLKA